MGSLNYYGNSHTNGLAVLLNFVYVVHNIHPPQAINQIYNRTESGVGAIDCAVHTVQKAQLSLE